eukprot:567063-Rhodomonas_salina.2
MLRSGIHSGKFCALKMLDHESNFPTRNSIAMFLLSISTCLAASCSSNAQVFFSACSEILRIACGKKNINDAQ